MGQSHSGESELQRLRVRVAELEAELQALRPSSAGNVAGTGAAPTRSDVAPRRATHAYQAAPASHSETTSNVLNDERLWQILEAIPVIIAIHDRDMSVQYVNRAGAAEVVPLRVGESPTAWISERDKERCERAFATVLSAGRADPFEVTDRNGAVWSMRLASLVNQGGRRQVLSCTVDVTQHRLLEAQVRQSQKVESLGALAGTVAHDFNNLLVAMLGNVELGTRWYDEGRDPTGCFDNIREAAQRAAGLCRQMLAYSGRERATLSAIDINDTVQRMAQLMRAGIEARIELDIELAEELPRIQADDSQVGQIVLNLLTNAAEAIGHRYGSVRVRTALATVSDPQLDYLPTPPENGEYVMLEVADDGPGMDARTRSMVFDPFFTSKEGGHGLGLSAVLGIVRSHGAAIRVWSAPGRGTTFSVLFPILDRRRGAAPKAPDRPGTEHGFGMVLVVDDEQAVRDLAAAVLREAGYLVVEAADGDGALALLEESGNRFRAVLLDLTMPRRDGPSTLAEIRKRHPRLPVVLSSGRQRHPDLADGDALVRWLGKPYSIVDLLKTVADTAALGDD